MSQPLFDEPTNDNDDVNAVAARLREKYPEMAEHIKDYPKQFGRIDDLSEMQIMLIGLAAEAIVRAMAEGIVGDDDDKIKAEFMVASLIDSIPARHYPALMGMAVGKAIGFGQATMRDND